MQKIPLTVRGAEMLKQELQHLKSVERPAIIEAIAEARTHGDLSENAEYEAAKEKQGFIEGRISELENKLSVAHIIDPTEIHAEGKIVFGCTVVLEDLENETQVRYQIVGDDEADIKDNKISISSPISRALKAKNTCRNRPVNAGAKANAFFCPMEQTCPAAASVAAKPPNRNGDRANCIGIIPLGIC